MSLDLEAWELQLREQEAIGRSQHFIETLPARYRSYNFETLREHHGNRAAIQAARTLNDSDNFYIWGTAGNGKTHLAIALAAERAREHIVSFWSSASLFATLRQAAIGEAERPNLLRPEILILDDLGKFKATDFVFQELYRVLEERWAHMKQTIFTANHKPSDAATQITGDPATAGAIISRLASGTVIEVKGTDERIGYPPKES